MCELALADPRFRLAAGIVHSHPAPEGVRAVREADLPARLREADVIIDFSIPQASARLAELAARRRKPIVIGTTGLTRAQSAILGACSKKIPVFHAPNFSLGMNLLLFLAELAASALARGPGAASDAPNRMGYGADILETHHALKRDAPSGTALQLAEAVRRAGTLGAVPIASRRLGGVVGEHALTFANAFERLELTHRAESRDAFAQGALEAALWTAKRGPGLYGMRQMMTPCPKTRA